MKAVYISEFGADGQLAIRDVEKKPSPAEGEVLVKVKAAGLNRADLLQMRGLYPSPDGYSPNIPGLEFAGIIAEVGRSVDRWTAGDRVFGITSGEAQAEFVLTSASHLAEIPSNLSFAEAAAVPEAFITAHDAIITQCGLKSGEALLIHAVGSGVGSAAMQLAKAAGAMVIGTSRTASKIERCKKLGLDHGIVVDKDPEFAKHVLDLTSDRGADVILDLVGASYFTENLTAIAQKGRIILVGLTGGSKAEFDLSLALRKRLTIIGTVLRSRSAEEKAAITSKFESEIVPLLAEGIVKPTVDRIFSAEEVADAYRYLVSNEAFGKVVIGF